MKCRDLMQVEEYFRRKVDERFRNLISDHSDVIYYNAKNPQDWECPVDDGCVSANRNDYLSSALKILWVLKEPNGEEGVATYKGVGWNGDPQRKRVYWDINTDPSRFATNANNHRFCLKYIAWVSYGILHGCEPVENAYGDISGHAIEVFKQLAVIEIGKTPGKSQTSDVRCCKLIHTWGDIVVEQIQFYDPDIVIVGMSRHCFGEFAKKFAGIHQECKDFSPARLYSWKDRALINCPHPSWRRNKTVWANSIIKTVRTAITRHS